MPKLLSVILLTIVPALLGQGFAHAQGTEYSYPELQVTPRATERLVVETKNERASKWTRHFPLQVSSLTTVIAAIGAGSQSSDPNGYAQLAGLTIGGGWLATSVLLSAIYTPYEDALRDVNSMPAKSQRDQLARERLAEEAIESAAALGRRLTWLSVATHLGAGAYIYLKADSGSFAQVAGGIAALAAFTPVLFQYRWQQVAADQRDYKKRIYGPVTGGLVIPEPGTGKAAGMMTLTLAF